METRTAHIDETRFQNLLERWNTHQALRSQGAEIVALAASRFRLDDARDLVRQAA